MSGREKREGDTDAYLVPAVTGVARADIGALFSSQFANSGFFLQVSGLAAGRYRVVVSMRSTVSGTFTSRSVDITVTGGPVP